MSDLDLTGAARPRSVREIVDELAAILDVDGGRALSHAELEIAHELETELADAQDRARQTQDLRDKLRAARSDERKA